MPKTTKLGIEITTSDETLFETWRKFINGEGEDSMANIIDSFAYFINQEVERAFGEITGLYGVPGEITIKVSDWDGDEFEKEFEDLNNDDAIIFSPIDLINKELVEEADIFVSTDEVNKKKVIFKADKTPEENITLNFFIVRGKENNE